MGNLLNKNDNAKSTRIFACFVEELVIKLTTVQWGHTQLKAEPLLLLLNQLRLRRRNLVPERKKIRQFIWISTDGGLWEFCAEGIVVFSAIMSPETKAVFISLLSLHFLNLCFSSMIDSGSWHCFLDEHYVKSNHFHFFCSENETLSHWWFYSIIIIHHMCYSCSCLVSLWNHFADQVFFTNRTGFWISSCSWPWLAYPA